jgi:hypothetical protein
MPAMKRRPEPSRAAKPKAKRKRNPYPGKPPGVSVSVWVEHEEALDRYITRWAAGLILAGVDENGRPTVRKLTHEEIQSGSKPPRRSKLLQKRIDQLRARKGAERKARARRAALRRWHPAGS